MSEFLTMARYGMSRYISPGEMTGSDLYGKNKFSLFFDMVDLGMRDEYRVSLGMLSTRYFIAAMWVSERACELSLEISYLEQKDVEDILQHICNEFNISLFLIDNGNFMLIPKSFSPGRGVMWEV